MAYYKSRGLRGSLLEEMINMTNEKYKDNNLALVQKIPTPIKPVEIDGNGHITLGYFEQKSTVDYIGAVQGIPVCFDAKETNDMKFALQNVHVHQVEFMDKFEKMGGISFLLIMFKQVDEIYYMPLSTLKTYIKRAENGGRKSIKYEEFDKEWMINEYSGVFVHYLEMLQKDLDLRQDLI